MTLNWSFRPICADVPLRIYALTTFCLSLQMYAKFCGLGIHNCLLHTGVVKLRAENRNITELLAYRAVATAEQATQLMVGL